MSTPEISIVLPVYNAADYLLECLRSISTQSFKNWELIAINDGSTDNSLQILKNFARNEHRMHVISRENRGMVATLNEGIKFAQGEWIARMDADDVCHIDRLEKQLAWAIKQNADVCGGGIARTGSTGGNSWVFPSSNEGIYTWMLFRSAFAHPTVMIRRKIALQFPYNEKFTYSQDYELWTRMALAKVSMTNYPATVLNYRIHSEQVSHTKKEAQTNLRMEITRNYWSHSELSQNLTFLPCLMDERKPIKKNDFIEVMRILNILETGLNDTQAIHAVNHHRVWFVYRSIHLGLKTIMPALKKMRLSTAKKFAVAILATFRAGGVIDFFRNADWIRYLPLNWFF
ncbi:MAG: glycosyltransferase [Candidatus Riflebacteria bacterium]|nr:glycosyltransferase [Candidatus Riflebacteria bacterium]